MDIEIATLALSAFNFAQPFLEGTANGVARKVGEDIWLLIKKPFLKNGKKDVEAFAKNEQEEFKKELQKELENDPQLASELANTIESAKTVLSGNFQQNINSYDKVEKQINIQHNSGNITM